MPIILDADDSEPIEDMPWMSGVLMVVSDCLRTLIEKECPGHAQFLPAEIYWKGDRMDLPPYWAVNWLHMIDCFDRDRSIYRIVDDDSEPDGIRYSFDRLWIDPAAIPPEVQVCRVFRYENTVLARDALKRKIEAAGMTGCQFYPIHQG